MRVKIQDNKSGFYVYEIPEGDTSLRPLKSCQSAKVELGHERLAQVELRIDLVEFEVEEADAIVSVVSKEGELKRIKSIIYFDGTEDVYA